MNRPIHGPMDNDRNIVNPVIGPGETPYDNNVPVRGRLEDVSPGPEDYKTLVFIVDMLCGVDDKHLLFSKEQNLKNIENRLISHLEENKIELTMNDIYWMYWYLENKTKNDGISPDTYNNVKAVFDKVFNKTSLSQSLLSVHATALFKSLCSLENTLTSIELKM